MDKRFTWFIAGVASTAVLSLAASFLTGPDHVVARPKAGEDFYNAFAIHGPLESDWSRVLKVGELDVWSDTAQTSLAITKNGRAVQLLTSGAGCCTFEIFESGEFKAMLKYGNLDERLISQGVDQRGTVWTYVDMGINGTVDFRFKDGVSDSTQQVVMMQFAGDDGFSSQVSNSGW